jgi:hypothetical protein
VDINDSGHYSFCVTDASGAQVQAERPLWELVRDFDELDARERWYQWLDEMVPRPLFHLAQKTNKVILDEIGLAVPTSLSLHFVLIIVFFLLRFVICKYEVGIDKPGSRCSCLCSIRGGGATSCSR